MRAFICVELDKKTLSALFKIIDQLKKMNLKANFVKSENLHLTLKFLGEISESETEEIIKKLQVLKFPLFSASLGDFGFFPNENFIRVLWLSLEPKEKFIKLNNQINETLGMAEDRFESHVTLARIKSINDKKKLLEFIKQSHIPELEFEVNEIKLKQSTLTINGPIYKDILKVELNKF